MAYSAAGHDTIIVGQQKYHQYKTADIIATVSAAGYFNAASQRFTQFDPICVIADTGGTPDIQFYVVTSASLAAVVVVSPVLTT